ncbi:MAG: molybdopterin-dependent oxidoreductase [Steroidobacteraceae bacterium]
MDHSASSRTHYRSCALCEAACGIEVVVDDAERKILSVRADKDDPLSKGFLCAKAVGLKALHEDPDRLRKPLRRKGRDFEEIGWDEALDEAGTRLRAIQKEHGADSVGYYFGNPTGHKPELLIYGGLLMQTLGSRQVYSPGTLDQIPKYVSATLMFGGPLVQPIPDLDRTQYLVVMGANPVVSQGSMIVAPGIANRIKAIRERGGKVVVIDPRRTETAEIADEYLPIRPGYDSVLLFAIIHVLFEENLYRLGRTQGVVKRLDELRAAAAKFPPERAASITGIDAAVIRRLARELAAAPSAAIHGRTGTCTQRFGSVAGWLIDAVNILTGNLDRAGGMLFSGGGIPTPILFNDSYVGDVPPMGRWHSRVRKLPETVGMLPTAALADEILTPGPGQVRGFITQAGNIVLSNPNGGRLAQAFESLEFMLSFDIYVNETTRHADIIIPGPSYAEHSDFAAVTAYEMIRKYVKWSPPIFPPSGPRDWQLMAGLAARLKGVSLEQMEEEFVSALLKSALAQGRPECAGVGFAHARAAIGDTPGADRIFDVMIRSGPVGDAFGLVPDGLTLERVKQQPHGLDYGPHGEQLPGVLKTPDRLIDLAPQRLIDDVQRMEQWLNESEAPGSLVMIGRRHIRSKNAWLHNLHFLVKGKPRCTLLINPRDAERRGLVSGDTADVRTHIAAVEALVEVSDEVMPGVVSLPHGWGHGLPGTRQRVAKDHPGVNANSIIDELLLDEPSASTVLNGVPVQVTRLAENVRASSQALATNAN